jgi:hypothetical protein
MAFVTYQLKPPLTLSTFGGGVVNVHGRRTFNVGSALVSGGGTIAVSSDDVDLLSTLDDYAPLHRVGSTSTGPDWQSPHRVDVSADLTAPQPGDYLALGNDKESFVNVRASSITGIQGGAQRRVTGAAGGGGLSSSSLSQLASVEELQDSALWPVVSTTSAESIALPPRLFPCRLAAVMIVNTGSAVASTNTNFWTVGLVKVVPVGPAGAASKLVRIAQKTTVLVSDPSATLPTNAGEKVYDAVPWSFEATPWFATDPDDVANLTPPDIFQVGDHLRITFTPSGTPGTWGPRAIGCRWEPYE